METTASRSYESNTTASSLEPCEQFEVLGRRPDSRSTAIPRASDLRLGPRHGVAVADEDHLEPPGAQLLRQRQAAHHMPDSLLGPTSHRTPIRALTPPTVAAVYPLSERTSIQ